MCRFSAAGLLPRTFALVRSLSSAYGMARPAVRIVRAAQESRAVCSSSHNPSSNEQEKLRKLDALLEQMKGQVRKGSELPPSQEKRSLGRPNVPRAELGLGASRAKLGLGASRAKLGLGAPRAELGLGAPRAELGLGAPRAELGLGAPRAELGLGAPRAELGLGASRAGWKAAPAGADTSETALPSAQSFPDDVFLPEVPPRPCNSIRDLFPEAEPLAGTRSPEPGTRGPWLLRRVLPLDGASDARGTRFPGAAENLPFLDLILASAFNRDTSFQGLSIEDLAVLDVECTGLSTGAGVYPFLVGLGFFRGKSFVIEQFLMEDFPEEPPMLEALVRRIRDFKGLITFNGKTFDVPLLETRFVLNRISSPLGMPHLDLLHAARRLWRGTLPSCGLPFIEEQILGVKRTSDVPGSLIPRIYFDYVEGVRRYLMEPVIAHNAQDIASTAALFPLFCRCLSEPAEEPLRHAGCQLGLAAWYRRLGRTGAALECLERAVLACRDAEEEFALSMHVANEYRRLRRWRDALEIWEVRARTTPDPARRALPCIETAKYHEHQDRDFARAIEWVNRALEPYRNSPALEQVYCGLRIADCGLDTSHSPQSSALSPSLDDAGDEELAPDPSSESALLAALVHRLRRLERKASRSNPQSAIPNPQSGIPNPKSEIRNPRSEIPNPSV